MSKYYYLVVGLLEFIFEDSKLSYIVVDFKMEIYMGLLVLDQKLIDLFYLKFDNVNVLKFLKDKEVVIDIWGNFFVEELVEYIFIFKEGGEVSVKEFFIYFVIFIFVYFNILVENVVLLEDYLVVFYYDYVMKCGNKFVVFWFEFNFIINNIFVVLIVCKYKWDIVCNIVGDMEICEVLWIFGVRDFGLLGEVDFFDQLVKISEIIELVECEKKLDVLWWNWMEDVIFFDYFIIECIFVFLLKLEMIECWIFLDKERGN